MGCEACAVEVRSLEADKPVHAANCKFVVQVVVEASAAQIGAAGLGDCAEDGIVRVAASGTENHAASAALDEGFEAMIVPEVIDVGDRQFVHGRGLVQGDDATAHSSLILCVIKGSVSVAVAEFDGGVASEIETIIDRASASIGAVDADVSAR